MRCVRLASKHSLVSTATATVLLVERNLALVVVQIVPSRTRWEARCVAWVFLRASVEGIGVDVDRSRASLLHVVASTACLRRVAAFVLLIAAQWILRLWVGRLSIVVDDEWVIDQREGTCESASRQGS